MIAVVKLGLKDVPTFLEHADDAIGDRLSHAQPTLALIPALVVDRLCFG